MAERIERKQQTFKRLKEIEHLEKLNSQGIMNGSKLKIQVIEAEDLSFD